MFFRRKEPSKPTPESKNEAPSAPRSAPDKRRHYRVRRSEAYPLTISLEGADGKLVDGDCVDISLGGAAALFDRANDPKIKNDAEAEIWVRSEARSNAVRAQAKVCRSDQEGATSVRYSFVFTNTPEIFAQLDGFYARFFNRRQHVRVIPDLNEKVPVRMSWQGGEISGKAHDISCGGIGLLLSRDKAAQLDAVTKVLISFSLPGAEGNLQGLATVKSRASFAKNVLFGLEFEEGGGIDSSNPALTRFVEHRVSAIKRWNALMAVERRGTR